MLPLFWGVGAPPILVYFSGDWDVHWGYGLVTHGQILRLARRSRWFFPYRSCTPVSTASMTHDSVAKTHHITSGVSAAQLGEYAYIRCVQSCAALF